MVTVKGRLFHQHELIWCQLVSESKKMEAWSGHDTGHSVFMSIHAPFAEPYCLGVVWKSTSAYVPGGDFAV
jgi:hypothetical protein